MAVPLGIAAIWIFIWRVQRGLTRTAREVPDGWVRAPGVVVDEIAGMERIGRGPEASYSYLRQPIVTYRTVYGVVTTFRSPLRATAMPRPGDAVIVVHDPHDPSQARIAPESIPRITRSMSTITGVVLLVIGVPLLLVFEAIGILLLTLD